MPLDPFLELVSSAENPQMVSAEGQALSLMCKLLLHIHQIKPTCMDKLILVYNEFERARLKREDFQESFAFDAASAEFIKRFNQGDFNSFLSLVEHWFDSIGFQHANAQAVLFLVISDESLQNRGTLLLEDHIFAVLKRYSGYTRGHNVLEFSLTPMLTLPTYNPALESRADYKARCLHHIDQYVQDVEKIHGEAGAIPFVNRKAEDKHLRALAYRLVYPNESWEQIGFREDVSLSAASLREGVGGLLQRLQLSLPERG